MKAEIEEADQRPEAVEHARANRGAVPSRYFELFRKLDIGDIVVCDKAIRDEGTSHHYTPVAKYATASPQLTADIQQTSYK